MHLLVVAAIEAEAAHVPDDVQVLVTGVGTTLAAVAVTDRRRGRVRPPPAFART